ncbi:MAG: alanine/glycine:cation symporter family protein [Flavobacteriales bacterium]
MRFFNLPKTSILAFLLVFSSHVFANQFEIVTENPSSEIKDGEAIIKLTDNTFVPKKIKWSKQDISLNSMEGVGFEEGRAYQVEITDASGKVSTQSFEITPSSGQEKVNSVFTPFVEWVSILLFSDPFAALGLYDPRIMDDQGQPLLHPNGDEKKISIPLVVVWLMLGAIFFTIKMGFVNVRGFKHSIDLIRGRFDKPEDKGEVSHFQALATALSGTVGMGNIAGVATAMAVGGPGATFWMIAAGLLGMSSKFVECTLAVKYRNINPNGSVSGGPMYYLSKGLKARNMGRFGKILAVTFAVLCVGGSIGGGNMYQANQTFLQLSTVFPSLSNHSLLVGAILAVMTGLVIVGGIKSIAKVTDKIVPLMVILYVGVALVIIGMHYDFIGTAFSQIFNGAFNADAAKGGFLGVLIMGLRRAAFSNEAGVGSASIAHSASKTDEPVSEGIVALLEPFIDTVVICTMTALVLIFTGFAQDPQGLDGVALTNAAFKSQFVGFDYVLTVAIFLFAFSTMISWSYYGLKSWTYLVGESKKSELTFKVIFLLCTLVGASSGKGAVMDFSDMMILAMAFPNIIGLLIMSSEVKADLQSYFSRVKSGIISRHK